MDPSSVRKLQEAHRLLWEENCDLREEIKQLKAKIKKQKFVKANPKAYAWAYHQKRSKTDGTPNS